MRCTGNFVFVARSCARQVASDARRQKCMTPKAVSRYFNGNRVRVVRPGQNIVLKSAIKKRSTGRTDRR